MQHVFLNKKQKKKLLLYFLGDHRDESPHRKKINLFLKSSEMLHERIHTAVNIIKTSTAAFLVNSVNILKAPESRMGEVVN